MQRTRKWAHLGAKARRLAARGLSPSAIAGELGVHPSTVHRWRVAGRLEGPRAARVGDAASEGPALLWSAAVRAAYPLDETDLQLVSLADYALSVTQNPSELPSIRLAAAGRFQSLVKQLAAHLHAAVDDPALTPARKATSRMDPRALLNPTTIQ